jgi:hypothetical protein
VLMLYRKNRGGGSETLVPVYLNFQHHILEDSNGAPNIVITISFCNILSRIIFSIELTLGFVTFLTAKFAVFWYVPPCVTCKNTEQIVPYTAACLTNRNCCKMKF